MKLSYGSVVKMKGKDWTFNKIENTKSKGVWCLFSDKNVWKIWWILRDCHSLWNGLTGFWGLKSQNRASVIFQKHSALHRFTFNIVLSFISDFLSRNISCNLYRLSLLYFIFPDSTFLSIKSLSSRASPKVF